MCESRDAIGKAAIIVDVCNALSKDRAKDAAEILRSRYPFIPVSNTGGTYSPRRAMRIFRRDKFTDRYSGRHLVFPGTLRLISMVAPTEFPFHPNWKMDSCHFAFYELFPVLDHVQPLARGGEDADDNLVTTSTVRNSAKANFTLEELNWTKLVVADESTWDGLTKWFLETVGRSPFLLNDTNVRRWHTAATT